MGWPVWVAAMLASGCGSDAPNMAAAEPLPPAAPAAPVLTDPPSPSSPGRREVAVIQHAGLLPDRATIVSREPVDGAIAFDFNASETPARVLAWYRRAQPGRGFAVTSELQEGAEHVVSGTTRQPIGDFSVRIASDGEGGTTAMVLVTPRR